MPRTKHLLLTLAVVCVAAAATAVAAVSSGGGASRSAAVSCQLSANGNIKHLVYIQFDNTHYNRDRSNVASDLEQMPHLLNFLTSNGTLFTNDHTILISHTAGGILSSLTGLYPDRSGINVSNSYFYFPPSGTPAFSVAFKYWTDLVDDSTGTNDPLPNMVTDGQKTTPAPWVPYTRAGCDFGGVGTANIELENTGTGTYGDISQVFGCPSTECTEAQNSNAAAAGTATRALAQTDFVGIAVHCAAGGGICAGDSNAKADKLPDEPAGYNGFLGLFGAKYVNPAITAGQPAVNDTSGQPINDPFGQPGFPGFDGMLAKNSLGYVAQMQEAGVAVTYAYISDAHDNHTLVRASGPGESDYQAQLAAYDDAFDAFFQRLAADGIDKSNTLFVVTVDEGDHYAGGVSSDGTWSHTFCNVTAGDTCPPNQIGEVNLNLNSALESGYTPPAYTVHSDSAPTFYVNGNPTPTDATLRELERKVAAAKAVNPYKSSTAQPIMEAIVDTVGEKALHMVNADPRRTPNFTLFADPDYFIKTANTKCTGLPGPQPALTVAECIDYHFAWSHGDIQDEIANTWVGFAGPGVQQGGVDSSTWTDHANVRPTILTLLGLKDDYVQDGRALIEALETKATPQTLIAHRETVRLLGDVYEQLNAPFGEFAASIAAASTKAVSSGSPADDSHYTSVEGSISSMTSQRDTLAVKIRNALNAAAFDGQALNEQQAKGWIDQAQGLIDQAAALAASS
jgi:hypothetical protein